MLEGIKAAYRSEDNFIGRMTGKSPYEIVTGKKPDPVKYYTKQTLETLGAIVLGAFMHSAHVELGHLTALGIKEAKHLLAAKQDQMLLETVKLLGKSENPAAHAALRVSHEVLNAIGQALRF